MLLMTRLFNAIYVLLFALLVGVALHPPHRVAMSVGHAEYVVAEAREDLAALRGTDTDLARALTKVRGFMLEEAEADLYRVRSSPVVWAWLWAPPRTHQLDPWRLSVLVGLILLGYAFAHFMERRMAS